jgi:hypothetical protein
MASTEFRIDTSDIRRMARDLESTVPGIKKEVGTATKEAGLVVAMEARALSSWSSRIPESVRAAGGLAKVVVRAGNANAPHAAPYEHGGLPGTFRHPVYGNRQVWVQQAARPFLAPALERKAALFEERVYRGVDMVFNAAGFH